MKKQQYTIPQNIAYILAAARRWQPSVPYSMALRAVCEGAAGFIWIYGAKLIIDLLTAGEGVQGSFKAVVGIVLVLAAAELLLLLGYEISRAALEGRILDVRLHMTLMVNCKMMGMPFGMLEDPEVLQAKRNADWATNNMTEGIEGLVKECSSFLSRVVMMAVAAVVLWQLSPLLVAVMFLPSLFRGWLLDWVAGWETEHVRREMAPRYEETYGYQYVATHSSYAKDIRLFGLQIPLQEKHRKVHALLQERVENWQQKWLRANVLDRLVELGLEGIMYAWLIYAVIRKDLGMADFTLYVGSIRSFNMAVSAMLLRLADMGRHSRMVSDYRIFLGDPESGESGFRQDLERWGRGVDGKPAEDTRVPREVGKGPGGSYEIRFEHVSFRYPGQEGYALEDLSLTLEAGKRLAAVGLNGAGKSTFIKLLCRLYEPAQGKIFLNGTDISTFDREDYFRLISPVFQNVECFAFSLAQNVSMGTKADTDNDRAGRVLKEAGLWEKVESLPQGIHTQLLKKLHEDGVNLSGGEAQKMALARALYKDAPIVVLDEPTAALDALAEYQAYMDFDQLIGGKTAVYISHRLSSTRFCHAVAMFAKGRMVEYGTHDSLMAAGGEYARMFALQAQYYQKGGVPGEVWDA